MFAPDKSSVPVICQREKSNSGAASTGPLNKSMVMYLLSTLQRNYHFLALEKQWRRSHRKAFYPSLSRDRLEHKPEDIKVALPYHFI